MVARHRGLAAALLALAVCAPPVALGSITRAGSVTATATERAAILKAWAAGTTLSRQHDGCLVVRLAASNHAYATVRFRRNRSCERRWAFNGVNVEKRGRGDRWAVAFEGSAYRCPVARIPREVQREFGICR
jgi:hypothetical protein